MMLLGLTSALALAQLVLHRVLKTLVTLESLLGMLVGVHIAAIPEGLNDVLETIVSYRGFAVYGQLLNELTDCFFIVALILYFVKLNGRLVVYV